MPSRLINHVLIRLKLFKLSFRGVNRERPCVDVATTTPALLGFVIDLAFRPMVSIWFILRFVIR